MELRNKVALVTGSTSGIGLGIAEAFAREGARVVLNGARKQEQPELVARIHALGSEAIYVQADVSAADQVRHLVEAAKRAFSRLDILVNNAAYGHGGGWIAHELAETEWDATVDVCLKGSFLCAKYCIPEMLKVGGGVIINIGSIEGVRGFPSDTAYQVAKAGQIQLTRALAVDYADENIRANIIHPGFIATPLNAEARADPEWMEGILKKPLIKRSGTPEEVAELALFLASDKAAYITGAIFTIDGGWTAH